MTTTTTVLLKKRVPPSPSLLRNHVGKFFAVGFFLVILCIGKFNEFTGFITGTEKAWGASTVQAMPKTKQQRRTETASSELSLQRVWTLFRGVMDLVLGTSSSSENYSDDKQLEQLIKDTELSDAAFRVKAEEIRKRIERGEMNEEELRELLAPLFKDGARPALPRPENR